jgi:hypothetical protein
MGDALAPGAGCKGEVAAQKRGVENALAHLMQEILS